MDIDSINFTKGDGLVPAIIQDADTGVILMLGYMDQEAIEKTVSTRKVTFYSRTKGRIWTKGETSGHYLNLVDIKIDCDQDTLLIKVNPDGPACHTGEDTCFKEKNQKSFDLHQLAAIIQERKDANPSESYTASLFDKGLNKITQKVGEEAVELVIEAMDDNRELFVGESADLLYHFLTLLNYKGVALQEVEIELEKRHKKSPRH